MTKRISQSLQLHFGKLTDPNAIRMMFWLGGHEDQEDRSFADSINHMAAVLAAIGLPQGTTAEFIASLVVYAYRSTRLQLGQPGRDPGADAVWVGWARPFSTSYTARRRSCVRLIFRHIGSGLRDSVRTKRPGFGRVAGATRATSGT